jgi:ABC-type sugar transport system permease subunit
MATSTALPARGAASGRSARKRPRRGGVTARYFRLPFALPAAVAILAISIYPLLMLIRMSVSEVSASTINGAWPFVGADNVRALLTERELQQVVTSTAVFVTIVTVLGVVVGLGVAIALRSSSLGSSFLLGMMVFIWALPPVVNGSIWKFLLADRGLVNEVLRGLGLTESGVPFLFSGSVALVSVAMVNAWAVIPFNALVFRSALLSVDDQVLEAAAVDGASRWQEVRHILVPQARATAVILTILTVVYAFRSFDYIYVMTFGGPGTATTTLPFLAYLQSFIRFDYGLGAATAVVTIAVVLVIGVSYAHDTRKKEAL